MSSGLALRSVSSFQTAIAAYKYEYEGVKPIKTEPNLYGVNGNLSIESIAIEIYSNRLTKLCFCFPYLKNCFS